VAARGASAACAGFGFARNTAATFDVFYWLQITNFDGLLSSAPNGPDYIDIWGWCLHARIIHILPHILPF
jgi:hypothetical protein